MAKDTGIVWFLRFPGACCNAGPFQFWQPINRRQFAAVMCRRFGIDVLPPQTRCWAGTPADWEQALHGKARSGSTREEQIVVARREGQTLREIAARHGLSYEGVRLILRKERRDA